MKKIFIFVLGAVFGCVATCQALNHADEILDYIESKTATDEPEKKEEATEK